MLINKSQATRCSGIQTSAMDEARAAAACVWCESSRRNRPNLRTATDITGTITSASTAQIVINEISLFKLHWVCLTKLKKMLKELLMIWWYNMPSHVPFRSSAKHIKLLCIKSSKAEQNANEFYIYRVQTYYLHVNFHEVENIKPRPIAVVVILRSASDKLVVAAFFIICVSSESLLKSSPVLVTSKNAISCGGISLESMSDPGCRTISAKFCTKQTCLPGLWDDWTSPS